jgi:hypothetical protein
VATTLNDLVLVHIDNKPGFYARIEAITPDLKPGWWQVKLLVLTQPLQVFSWILDESQINGAPFSMGGTPVLLEKLVSPVAPPERGAVLTSVERPKEQKGSAKVVRLPERNKDR